MSGWSDYQKKSGGLYGKGVMGGILGADNMTKPGADSSSAISGLDQTANAYKGIAAPTLAPVSSGPMEAQQAQSYQAGPSAYGGIQTDPSGHQAQQAQMAALSNLAKNGGRNAASDANLAQIQQGENANAAGQRGAIMQNMQARGMGGSGNSLLAQLSNSQNATNNQSAQDMQVRGQDQNTALQAGQAAAGIGSNMENQSFNEQAQKASAADAIAKFNAGNQGQTSMFNAGQGNAVGESNAGRNQQGQEFNSGLGQQQFADTMGIAQGNQQGGKASEEYWADKYKEDQKANGGMLGGAEKAGAAILAASRGGGVPGVAPVRGNSPLNDIVKVNTSPGEVVVDRDLRQHGTKDQIANFVRNPPPIKGSNQDREAMLGALGNLRRRR